MDLLRFRCTACGNCCRGLRVAVTDADVARLLAATGRPATDLFDWLEPDAVDMTGEPESFVELGPGRRLLVLAHAEGACQLLASDNRCSAYGARPLDCRLFPLNPSFEPESSGKLKRLELLPLSDCRYELDGHTSAANIKQEDELRWQELHRYQAHVARWNRLAKHQRRLGQRVGTAEVFFDFLRRVRDS